MAAEPVTFQATLQDNVSPNLEKLEKQLQAMGQSPIQIKMILDAVDHSTPKIKQAQQQLDRLPKKHTIELDVKGGIDRLREELNKVKQEFSKPFTLPFRLVDQDGNNLNTSFSKMFNVKEKIAMPLMGSMPGSNMLYGVGMGAGIAGAVTGLSGMMQQSFQQNSEIQQAQEKLTVALRDNAGATQELNKVIAAAQKSPYTFQQTLQADVLGRSYQMPVFKGESKQVPQGYLQVAGNMSAAMGSTPDDAMMALAMARQHQFRRMQMYGIRMTSQDFGSGGQYAGMSVDQALELATKRYQGAMSAQMHTFQGMMSNIKDVIGEQVIRPIGANVFQSIQGRAGGLEQSLSSPGTQERIGKAVEQFQHLTVTVMQNLTKMHQYFDIHLKTPLEELVSAIKKIGTEFAQAFGGTTAAVIKTFSEAILSLVAPMAQISKEVPALGTMFGFMKGMQMVGLGHVVNPLQHFQNAVNPQSHESLLGGIGKGILGLPSMAVKLGGFAILTDLINAHKATVDMNDQFKNMHGNLGNIEAQTARIATNMATSDTAMKTMVAYAAQGIPQGRMSPGSRANLALNLAQAGPQIGQQTGWSGISVIQAIQQQMKASQDYSIGAVHKFGTELLNVAAVAHKFGDSLTTVMQVMQTFAPQAGPIGLGGLSGLPALLAMSHAANQFGVTAGQQNQGYYSPDQVVQQMLTQYSNPTIQNLQAVGRGNIGDYWSFRNRPGQVARYGTAAGTYSQQAIRGQALQTSTRGLIGHIAPTALSGQYGIPTVPDVWKQAGLGVNFQQLQKGNPLQTAQNVMDAWNKTSNNFTKSVNTINTMNAAIDQTNNKLTQLNQAQASVNLQMEAFQHQIQLSQRALEDAQLTLSRYTLDNLAPLEKSLSKVQIVMDQVNHSMQDAQFNMSKFGDGLLSGEQAVLNQLHALSLYNEQLNYLKMQYTQIGAQLGTNVYTRGFSARVGPMMGLSLEEQMQELQRKQQMEQAKYDITYGEGHYQMQQAQRSQFQRTEMPLNQRLAGIKAAQTVIDKGTMQNKILQDQQFAIQRRVSQVNLVIMDQQNHITALQNSVTAMNQSQTMRNFQDEQYKLGQAIGQTNIHLTQQQNILSQWENTRDNLNQMKQDLQSLFDSLMVFTGQKGGPGALDEAKKAITAAGQEGLLTGGHWNPGGPHSPKHWVPGREEKNLLGAVSTAQAAIAKQQKETPKWWENRSSMVDVISKGVWGLFTGDTIRRLAGWASKMPVIGGMASTVLGIGADVAPVASMVAATLVTGGAIGWAIKRIIRHLLPDIITEATPHGIQSSILKKLGFTGAADRAAEKAATSKTFGERLSGTLGEHIMDKFKPFLHPGTHLRGGVLRGLGAAGGYALGGPFGGLLGQWGGGWVHEHTPPLNLHRHAAAALFGRGRDERDAMRQMFGVGMKGTIQDPLIVGMERSELVPGLGRSRGIEAVQQLMGSAANVVQGAKDAVTKGGVILPPSVTRNLETSSKSYASSVMTDGRNRARAVAQELKGAAQNAKAAALSEKGAVTIDKSGGLFRGVVGRLGGHVTRLGRFAGIFGTAASLLSLLPNNWQKRIDHFANVVGSFTTNGVNKFVDVIKNTFVRAIESFGGILGDIKNFFRIHVPGFHAPSAHTVSGVARGDEAASKLEREMGKSSAFRKTIDTVVQHGGKFVKYAGSVLRIAGHVGGALSFLPAGADALKGQYGAAAGQGVNALSYFTPVVGQLQIINQLLGLTGHGASTKSALGAFNYATSHVGQNILGYAPGGTGTGLTGTQQVYSSGVSHFGGSNLTSGTLSQQGPGGLYEASAYIKGTNTLLDLQAKRKGALLGAVKEFNNLNAKQLDEYTQLSAKKQEDANQASLSGPQGLQNYLTTVGRALGNHYNARLAASADYFTKEGQTAQQGYQAIGTTTGSWLNALTKQIKQWEKSNGLNITTGQAASIASQAINSTVQIGRASISLGTLLERGMEHGGIVEANPHKHRLGQGKTVRMVEEGHPEMVIPLAPHRRDRARNLMKQAHTMLGMAAGGYVNPMPAGTIPERVDMGVDYSFPVGSILKAIGNAKVNIADASGSGWPGGGYLNMTLSDGPMKGRSWYLAEDVAPLVKAGQMVSAGQAIAKYLGGGSGTEWGWAAGPINQTLAAALGQQSPGSDPGAWSSAAGASFSNFLASVGAPAGILGSVHGNLSKLPFNKFLAGRLSSVSPMHLKHPPSGLSKHGVVGLDQSKILTNYVKYWQHKLNSKASSQGGKYNVSTQGLTGNLKNVVQQIAKRMGWDGAQIQDWLNVIQAESGGDLHATNPTSGAYGIAQMLASGGSPTNLGPNKQKYLSYGGNPNTVAGQLVGMANYMKQSYHNPAGAWAHELSHHWYVGGKRRVPYDNYPAILHQDEMVVPAAVAHAARSMASQGTGAHIGGGSLGSDREWLRYYDAFTKASKSISNLEYDIHHIKRYVEDTLHKKSTGHADTSALAALNAALRAARGRQIGTQTKYYGAIAHHLSAIGDPSSGESTTAGVLREKETYKNTLKIIETHDPVLLAETKKLHKDQNKLHTDEKAYHKLWAQVHSKNHHESQAERKRLAKLLGDIKGDRHNISRDEMRIHQRIAHDQKEVFARYLEGAAGRGVNAALIKAITGRGLNKQQLAAYKAIENASRNGHHATQAQIKQLEKSLGVGVSKIVTAHGTGHKHLTQIYSAIGHASDTATKSRAHIADRADATRSAVRDHIALVDRNHRDAVTHRARQVDHMGKVEGHHKRLEDKMDRLISKDMNINIRATGATVTATGAHIRTTSY